MNFIAATLREENLSCERRAVKGSSLLPRRSSASPPRSWQAPCAAQFCHATEHPPARGSGDGVAAGQPAARRPLHPGRRRMLQRGELQQRLARHSHATPRRARVERRRARQLLRPTNLLADALRADDGRYPRAPRHAGERHLLGHAVGRAAQPHVLPELLQDAGYETALFGKWVWPAATTPTALFNWKVSTSACSSASSPRRRAASIRERRLLAGLRVGVDARRRVLRRAHAHPPTRATSATRRKARTTAATTGSTTASPT